MTQWTTECQASLSFTISQSLHRLMSIESMMPFNHLIFYHSFFLLLSIFPSIRVFSNSQLFSSNVLELQVQSFQGIFRVDFLYDWLVWSPWSPRDSQEFSPASQFQNINSSVLSLFYGPTLICVHYYWKNQKITYVSRHANMSSVKFPLSPYSATQITEL